MTVVTQNMINAITFTISSVLAISIVRSFSLSQLKLSICARPWMFGMRSGFTLRTILLLAMLQYHVKLITCIFMRKNVFITFKTLIETKICSTPLEVRLPTHYIISLGSCCILTPSGEKDSLSSF